MKQAVHCKNKEEWEIVNKALPEKIRLSHEFTDEFWETGEGSREGACKCLHFREWCGLKWYTEHGYEIITFEDFEVIYLRKEPRNENLFMVWSNLLKMHVYGRRI